MRSLFVSYAHSDSPLVDRLVADLACAGLPVNFDKWLLRVGDSIIERLSAAVTGADAVVVVLSPASVASNWVRKELALAMAMEVDGAPLRVLPALSADCELPPALRDKFYADFRSDYVDGLTALLRALRADDDPLAQRRVADLRDAAVQRAEFEALLAAGEAAPVRHWLAAHREVLAGGMRAGALIPWGAPGTGRYLRTESNSAGTQLSAIVLGPVHLDPADPGGIDTALQQLELDLHVLADSVRSAAGLDRLRVLHRLHADIDPLDYPGWPGDAGVRSPGSGVWVARHGRLVAGRRTEYDETPLGRHRLALINRRDGHHDLQSYDRFLDHFERIAAARAT